ncbi:MAG: threonine synthase, partial [Mesorhizobium sp.]
MARIRTEFDAGRASVDEVAATIRQTLAASSYMLDPHTAAAMHVAAGQMSGAVPMVVLGTAHPAKFPAAVEA